MESSYGIGIKNRYELFYDDEDDPLDVIKQHDEDKKKKKESKLQQEKENKVKGPAPKAKIIAPTKKGPKDSLPVKAQESPVSTKNVGENNRARGPKVSSDRAVKFTNIRDENKELEQKNRRNREDNRTERGGPPSNDFRERGGFDRNSQWDGERSDRGESREPRSGDAGEARRGRGGFGGSGGGRGGFRGRGRGGPRGGFDNRGKREFERQSGSDKSSVKAVDKREGAGSHNWGTIKDEMETLNNTTALSSDEAGDWAEKPEEPVEVQSEKEAEQPLAPTDDETGEKPPLDDAAKQMTLDEWKKEQEKNRAVPQFNIRKPGEGEDNTQWKKTYVLKKKDVDSDAEELDEDDDEEYGRRGRAKHVVHDIEINYADSRRGRGGRGRGGRGSGLRSGGGGRGAFSRPTEGPSAAGLVASNPSSGGSRENVRGGRGGRSGNKNQSAPKVDDENDFPSLVAA